MRRLRTMTFVSLVAIIASLAVLGAGPLRDFVQSVRMEGEDGFYPPGFASRLRAQAERRADDPQAWLALAVVPGDPPDSAPPDLSAFERVFELRPNWAAPYLALGTRLAAEVPLVRPAEMAAAYPERPPQEESPPDAEQVQKLADARRHLLTARSLEPDNAAPDYLLAYLALAEQQDDEALAWLRSGFEKDRWSLGQREVTIAVYESTRPFVPAVYGRVHSLAIALTSDFRHWRTLRNLARTITGMSVLARERGDHEHAIFLRESVMHLGRCVIAGHYDYMEVLTGIVLWRIGASERLTPAEEEEAIRGLPEPEPEEEEAARQAGRDALQEARLRKMAQYLGAHGRPDLAEQVLSYGKDLTAWRKESRARTADRFLVWMGDVMPGSSALFVAGIAAGLALAWLVVGGLAYAILMLLKRRPVPVTWAWWKWALVVVGCLGGIWALCAVLASLTDLPAALDDSAMPATLWAGPIWRMAAFWAAGALTVALLGLPLLAVATLVITWLVRRRAAHPPAGFGRQYVGTLMAVLLPVAALVLVCAAGAALYGRAKVHEGAERMEVMIYDSEAAYYGLQPPLGFPAPDSAADDTEGTGG